ncbi:hypothetical protein ON010_g1951 [Phytophthora cinnamomi]|nr:hypothetical protein ON010_g1951 [Phytophthora cinnamomi]
MIESASHAWNEKHAQDLGGRQALLLRGHAVIVAAVSNPGVNDLSHSHHDDDGGDDESLEELHALLGVVGLIRRIEE